MIFGIVISVFLSGISLSMDAFAVSICNGMVYSNLDRKKTLFMPFIYGLFQALMPIIGFYIGLLFIEQIEAYDHWVAFAVTEVLLQGVATSIDALAVGFSLNTMLSGVSDVQLWAWLSVLLIGLTTFEITFVVLIIGKKVGKLFQN